MFPIVTVEWRTLWRIEPCLFDPRLLALCEEAVREVTGDAPRLPSGPLPDAAEMVPHMPPGPYRLQTIEAFLRLVRKVVMAREPREGA